MTGFAAGAVAVPLMRANTGLGKSRNERLLRPPGALDEPDFLGRCIRCGECMKVCPNNALQPALVEAGLEGLWTPTLVPRIGYCEPSRVLCSEVCPTGAIWQITPKEKGWVVGVGAAKIEASDWARHFMIAGAACRGPWPPNALCARSGARCRPRRFMWKKPRLWIQQARRNTEAAARGSQPLCGLRRLRICLPAAGTSCRVRDEHWRKPLAQQPDTANGIRSELSEECLVKS